MKPTITDFICVRAEYDPDGIFIWGVTDFNSIQKLCDIRSWGAIQQLFKTEQEAIKFQDELGEWIADAINQKLSKEKK